MFGFAIEVVSFWKKVGVLGATISSGKKLLLVEANIDLLILFLLRTIQQSLLRRKSGSDQAKQFIGDVFRKAFLNGFED